MTSPDFVKGTPEDKARSRIITPWENGTLFHNFKRFPARTERIDRLDSILRHGIIPPGLDATGTVVSDINLTVIGKPEYTKVVFLHRFRSPASFMYIPSGEDTLTVLVDRDAPVLTFQDMGEHWPVLFNDEVYHAGIISPDKITGIVAVNGDSILDSFGQRLQELGVPLYTRTGNVLWPK